MVCFHNIFEKTSIGTVRYDIVNSHVDRVIFNWIARMGIGIKTHTVIAVDVLYFQ